MSHNFLIVDCNSTKLGTSFVKWTANISCKVHWDWCNCWEFTTVLVTLCNMEGSRRESHMVMNTFPSTSLASMYLHTPGLFVFLFTVKISYQTGIYSTCCVIMPLTVLQPLMHEYMYTPLPTTLGVKELMDISWHYLAKFSQWLRSLLQYSSIGYYWYMSNIIMIIWLRTSLTLSNVSIIIQCVHSL